MRNFYAAASFRSEPVLLGFPSAEARLDFLRLDASSEKAKSLITVQEESGNKEKLTVSLSDFHDKSKVQKSWGDYRHKRKGRNAITLFQVV